MPPLLFWGGFIPTTGAVAMIIIALIYMNTVMATLLFWGWFTPIMLFKWLRNTKNTIIMMCVDQNPF